LKQEAPEEKHFLPLKKNAYLVLPSVVKGAVKASTTRRKTCLTLKAKCM